MTQNKQNLVSISNVDKVFKRGSEEIHVLGGLDLEIPDGEFLALMGPSGSGKSTLLNLKGPSKPGTLHRVFPGRDRRARGFPLNRV